MSMKESLSIVRNKYPDYLIRYAFECGNLYCYMMSAGKRFDPSDLVVVVTYDKRTGEITVKSIPELVGSLTLRNRRIFKKNSDNPVLIDITKEQFQALQKL